LVYEIADYWAVAFEVSGFLTLVWSRKPRKFWLLLAGLFHLSNTMVLNIPFLEHVIVYLGFVNFQNLLGKTLKGKELLAGHVISIFLSFILFSVVFSLVLKFYLSIITKHI